MIDLRALLLATSAAVVVQLPGQEPSGSRPGPELPRVEAGAAKPAEVGALIRQLGADSYRQRVEAERKLRELGAAAVPALQDATKQDDVEVQWRARRLLRQIEGDAPLSERSGSGATGPQRNQEPGRRAEPRTGQPSPFGDNMRQDFEALFQRLERDFGLDVPRARFFDEDFFRDLQQQMQDGASSRSQGMSLQIGPDGAVKVEVQQRNEQGEVETKTYEAPDLETFQREHPGVLRQGGLGLGMPFGRTRLFGGDLIGPLQFGFGGPEVEVVPFGTRPQTGRQPAVAIAPEAPPAGQRLGVSIRPEVPPDLREYLDLPEGVGLMVEGVQDGSLAAALGLARGDIVTRIGSVPIGSPQDVQKALGSVEVGGDVEVHFVRKGQEQSAKAKKTEANEASKSGDDEGVRDGRLQRRRGAGAKGGTKVR